MRALARALAAILLASCTGMPYMSSGPFRVEPPFWTRNGEHIRIAAQGPRGLQISRPGADTVLSQLVTEIREDGLAETVMAASNSFRIPVDDLVAALERGLRERGFDAESTVQRAEEPHRIQGGAQPMRAFPMHGDLASVPAPATERLPLVFTVDVTWSVGRQYEELIPRSAERVCFGIEGALGERRVYGSTTEQLTYWYRRTVACESLPRRWRDEGASPLIADAVQRAWNDAAAKFVKSFFAWHGERGSQRVRHGYIGSTDRELSAVPSSPTRE
jgi:hypothetical protein